MSLESNPVDILRSDYRPTEYATDTVDLTFSLQEEATEVTCVQRFVRREPLAPGAFGSLRLDGQELELLELAIDGQVLGNNEFTSDAESLTLTNLPPRFELRTVTRIYPDQNTSLEGLYRSSGMYCTQCEAEGFRKITYYQDRPDVLARFTTHIEADAAQYPVLLANGNPVAEEPLAGGRRRVSWEDPFPKPSYLFALVAGDLASIEDHFVTMSGRTVQLVIYSEPHNIEQCHYAMDALKRSMRWDETTYGREYDLDLFMIVAVDDFNMGAMENKGLNVFNTSCVLASPDTATDAAYQRVEAVVAHEYFHNWSGNRVTCRDWFQLSLKEGFTVFRDAQFSAQMNGATAKRIEDVNFLRSVQFAEDGGPLAHPVRPESYQEISNFYTTTIYEKGAEVVRMLHTLLGPEGFRRGSDLYFERHDGEAATVEDFVCAMEAANGADFEQFRRWYSQAGTPQVTVQEQWHDGTLSLILRQALRTLPGTPAPKPQHIPIELGLLDASGKVVVPESAQLTGDLAASVDDQGTVLVQLTQAQGTLAVAGLPSRPEVSFLRGFSAPVRVDYARAPQQLALLARADSDGFARWDALQTLIVDGLLGTADGDAQQAAVLEVFSAVLGQAQNAATTEALSQAANMLSLPSEGYLFEQAAQIDVHAIVQARDRLLTVLADELRPQWQALHEKVRATRPYEPSPEAMAQRQLAGIALRMVAAATDVDLEALTRALERQLAEADNLTDRASALATLVNHPRIAPARSAAALQAFYERFSEEALVVNLWLQLQATATTTPASGVVALTQHPAFDARNPNKLRSVLGAFASGNARNFHALDGSGYQFLADQVATVDQANPQIAARLVQPLSRWARYEPKAQESMRAALEGLKAGGELSKDLNEIVSKSL